MRVESGNDKDLVEGCLRRDSPCWSSFIKKYSGLISISSATRLRKHGFAFSGQDIEDIRQEVLALLWKGEKLRTVRNRDNIAYWLAVVSGNSAVAYMRKRLIAEPERPVSLFEKVGEKEISELIPVSMDNPIDDVLRNELSKKIGEAIGSLPAKEKLIIKLNVLHGKSYPEIVDILGLPRGTVSNYLKRAKEKLQKSLKDFI